MKTNISNYKTGVNYFIMTVLFLFCTTRSLAQTVADSTKGGTKNLGNEDINV